MYYFDPMYFVFVAPGLLFAMWASYRVQHAFHEYSKLGTSNGYTGAEAARLLLNQAGIHDVEVVPSTGLLSDHYNPATKQLALSEGVYNSQSVAAVGIAAHETGHAIQHANHYGPLWLRTALAPTANFGSTFAYVVMGVGLVIHPFVVMAGLLLFSAVLLFQIVTLPVEFNASARAKKLIVESGIIHPSEKIGVDQVLNAAALTYVAAVVSSLLVMLYYLYRTGELRS